VARHLKSEAVVARPPSNLYRFQKLVRRNKLAFTAAAAVAWILVLGVVVSTWQAVRATRAEREQVRLRQQAEVREKLAKAQALCDHLQFDDAEKLVRGLPAPVLHAEARDATIVFTALVDYFARIGRWREAAVDARKAVECDPKDHLNYVSLLSLLAANGDHESYHHYCREFLDRFGESDDVFGERIAKACLILPSSGPHLAVVDKLAEVAVTSGTNKYLPYFQFAKGLADYRQGRFASAAEWMVKSIDNPFYGDGHSRYVQAHMVLAMAQWRLKQPVEARKTFIKGIEIEQTKLPKLESGDLGTGWYWRDWIIAHALLNEAKSLIEDGSKTGGESK
jgi:tetratricopeptide (TPR) repeat protein